uniref:Peptidase C1A papain C-terminal domain-containing protein n=1 Tax=Timema monikensis TaxID=170555 RepID=A0A7R9HKX4_9NEOP|nr:unnamed protein product [Timema monikensis]
MCSRYTGLIVDEETDPITDEDMSILGSSETGTSSSNGTTNTAIGGTSYEAISLDPSIPKSFDWREKGYETPVLNQGGCGACWAFTAVEVLEAQWLKVKNRSVGLSEQYLIDCSEQKCSGGTFKNVFEFIKQNWTVARKAYPYTALGTESCHEISRKIATLKSYKRIPANNEAAMMNAIANHGPIVCGVCASSQGFMLYHSGIFSLRHDGENCTTLNHAITLWGYVNDNNSSYFILKNSWGPTWGESGYMRLQMGENNCVHLTGIRNPVSPPTAIHSSTKVTLPDHRCVFHEVLILPNNYLSHKYGGEKRISSQALVLTQDKPNVENHLPIQTCVGSRLGRHINRHSVCGETDASDNRSLKPPLMLTRFVASGSQ